MYMQTGLLKRRWLSNHTFEIALKRPPQFEFFAGQRLRIILQRQERDYTIVSAPTDPELRICVRLVPQGEITSALSKAAIGTQFQITGPHGYFTYHQSQSPAVFVATGTGIAPFRAMVLAGANNYTLLHGVTTSTELYYANLFQSQAALYMPCLSEQTESMPDAFHGRVTAYLAQQFTPGQYTFYLCGRQAMIRDVTHVVDERFSGSLVYTEIFY